MGRKAWVAVVTGDGYFLAVAEEGYSGYVPVKEPVTAEFRSFADANERAIELNAANGIDRVQAFAILDDVMDRKAYRDNKTGRPLL